MDLHLDEQQNLLSQSIDRYLERRLPFDKRRTLRSPEAIVQFWRDMDAELGIGAAGCSEADNGFGGGAEAEMIVAGSLARALAVTPYIDCHVLTAHLLAAVGRTDLVRQIAVGERLIVTAIEEAQTYGDARLIETRAIADNGGWRLSGNKLTVNFADQADAIVIPARDAAGRVALFLVDRAMILDRIHPYRLIDDMPSADVALDDIVVPATARLGGDGDQLPALERAINRAIAAQCAEAAAIADVMVADTVAYTKQRVQFGVPLASFQALQHRMVDMYLAAQEISAASLLATLRHGDPASVSAAKVTVAEGLRLIGQEAVQMHGAMGLTEELRIGHYFKRATVIGTRLGSSDHHVGRYAALCAAA